MLELLSPRGRSVIVLAMMLCVLMLILPGCATKPPPSSVSCPERPPIPAHLVAPASPSAQAYSSEVQSFLQEVANWLRTLRQTKTQSSE